MAEGPVILDGGLSTELEAAGHDISGTLWSARLLRDRPDAVVAAHRAFAAAGAQVATTASYQASFEGFARVGIERTEAASLLRLSVVLAREAAPESWVAASVGPYGAVLAGGEEYSGAYVTPGWRGRSGGAMSVRELRDFHRPRLEVLAAAGPDVLAVETLPALAEVEAVLDALEGLGVPAWVSLTTAVDGNGVATTRLGEPAAEAFAMIRSCSAVVAAGVNCIAPADVAPGLVAARTAALPLVVYPNSAESWDAVQRRWIGRSAGSSSDDTLVEGWLGSGAQLIGGCCRVRPADIARLTVIHRGDRARPSTGPNLRS